jgi:hypothetical protein
LVQPPTTQLISRAANVSAKACVKPGCQWAKLEALNLLDFRVGSKTGKAQIEQNSFA